MNLNDLSIKSIEISGKIISKIILGDFLNFLFNEWYNEEPLKLDIDFPINGEPFIISYEVWFTDSEISRMRYDVYPQDMDYDVYFTDYEESVKDFLAEANKFKKLRNIDIEYFKLN